MKKRVVWMDVMRLVCAFLVIVNHTNSPIFKATTPANGSWWLSILWYYISKIAVPIFVMISGACLLPRQDSYRRHAARFMRMLGALLLFSYLFFLYDAWTQHGLWPRMTDMGAFFSMVWTAQCGDAFWYLYFYMALIAMLPLFQRMAAGMKKADFLYLIGMCYLFGALWPLIAHYAPAVRLTPYFDVPLFSIYIGLFFTGHLIHRSKPTTRGHMLWAGAALAASLILSVALTRLEYASGVQKYWFMDDRMHPSATTVVSAVSAVILARGLLSFELSSRASRVLTALAGCSFGIYLLEEIVIYLTEAPIYLPLCSYMPAFFAALLWEAAVFIICLVLTLGLKRIPGVKKLLS